MIVENAIKDAIKNFRHNGKTFDQVIMEKFTNMLVHGEPFNDLDIPVLQQGSGETNEVCV